MLVELISQNLNLPPSYILSWGAKATHAYKTYSIPKRSGGWRTIHHPAKELKLLQRWLLRHVIADWPVHSAAAGYRVGRGIRQHAERHADSRFLLRMDMRDFFPSITRRDVENYLESKPPTTEEWTDADQGLFSAIVCRGDQLTIGAPSSPALSNALCFALDTSVAAAATLVGVTYTRYADDMFFSTLAPNVLGGVEGQVRQLIEACELPGGLEINNDKTRHLSKKYRRVVTGLVIGSRGEVTIGRKRKRFLRRQLHRFDDLSAEEKAALGGTLAFVRDVEPDYINALIIKYGQQRVRAAMDVDSTSIISLS